MKSVIAAVAAAALVAAFPAAASASSVVDQYIEQVPSGGGGKPSSEVRNDSSGGSSGPGATGVGAAGAAPVNSSGSEREQALSAVLGSDRKGDGASDGKKRDGDDRRGLTSQLEQSSDAGLGSAIATLLGSDRGGAGLLLPAALLASLAVAAIAARRRSRAADRTGLGE